MLVFHSWSGPRSRAVAEAFATFLSQVIQAVEPWLSQDIAKGTRWNETVSNQLEKTSVGISVLTPENLHADWILFEAGAMSKIKSGLVCTLLIGLKPTDVEAPLAQFQHTLPERDDVKRLVRDVNLAVAKACERALSEPALEKAFNTHWPELAAAFKTAKNAPSSADEPTREPGDLLEEILELVRGIARRVNAPLAVLQSKNLDGLIALAAANTGEDRSRFYKQAIDMVLSGSHADNDSIWRAWVTNPTQDHTARDTALDKAIGTEAPPSPGKPNPEK